jgi:hypothetical protein
MNLELIRQILNDNDTKEALRKMLLSDEMESKKGVYVWCAKKTTTGGKNYYHPVVANFDPNVPELEDMLKPDFYQMTADENQFRAYDAKDQMDMMARMTGQNVMLICVPKDVYKQLEENLRDLMTRIITAAKACFAPIDALAAVSRTNGDLTKKMVILSTLEQLDYLYSCVSEEMEIEDGSDHEYVDPEADLYDDAEEGDYDDDDDDDDDDDYYDYI